LSRAEVQAWLAFAEKRNEDALEQMRALADTQDKVGKQEVDIPAREMLGKVVIRQRLILRTERVPTANAVPFVLSQQR